MIINTLILYILNIYNNNNYVFKKTKVDMVEP